MVSRGIACVDCVTKCERSHGKQGGFLPADRFFKIMFGRNCSKFMYLPPASAKIMKHLTNRETQIEDLSGKRWSVTLSPVNGSLAFERGWEKFYVDHGLKVGEFLTFEYIEGSHFTVQIYGKSARERTSFDSKMPRQSKKRGRDQGTASENETVLASGDEFQNRKTKLAVENAGLGVSKLHPIPVDIEDPICMINKSDWYHEEHRNSLYDLSFEMENRTSDSIRFEGAVITMLDPRTETEQHDVNLDNASGPKLSLSCSRVLELTNPVGGDAVEKAKTTAEDAQVVVIEREIADEKVDDTQTSPYSRQEGSHSGDALTNKFYKKPSGNREMKKGMLDNVCSFQDVIPVALDKPESISVSPFIGSSKIVEEAVKSIFGEFSISSSTVKDPLGLHAIKKEVKMEDTANIFHQGSCSGKEPSLMWNEHKMITPLAVKAEPDLPYETGQLDTTNPFSICPFSAEIESQLYLEVPVQIILARRKRLRNQSIRAQTMRAQIMKAPVIIYLRGSVGRLWPVVYREYVDRRALTLNWTKFCVQNNIKPGDKCRFQVEEHVRSFIYRVNVTRGSG